MWELISPVTGISKNNWSYSSKNCSTVTTLALTIGAGVINSEKLVSTTFEYVLIPYTFFTKSTFSII